jgi:cobalt/nickel transport system ATP-binding protein
MKLDEAQVGERVALALEKVGIAHLGGRAPYRLSAGEKRAAAIASVLAMGPDILIMDEPTSALDPSSRRRLINLLKGFEHTKIVTSHDLDMVLELCQRVLVLKDGILLCDGPAHQVLSDGNMMIEAGLEVPQSLRGCPSCGWKG